MCLATSSCNACQERHNITDAFLRAALPMSLVTAGCKPAKQHRRTESTSVRAALTMGTRPRKSRAAPDVTVLYEFYLTSSSRYSFVRFLSTTFPDRYAKPRKERPYFSDPRSHTTRKSTAFRAQECFHHEFTRF